MDPRHAPVPSPATHTPARSGHSSPDTDYDSESNDKRSEISQAHDTYQKHSQPSQQRPRDLARAHDSVISPFSSAASAPPSPGSSFSSDARQHHAPPPSHDTRHSRVSYPPRAHLDPEKAAPDAFSARSHRASAVHEKTEYLDDHGPEDKACQLLFFLSGPCALLSAAITLWTLVALLLALALHPLRYCTARAPLRSQLTGLLAPALELQLRRIYSSFAADTADADDDANAYSVPLLLLINLASPLVALGVAVASWTAAGFWFFSLILGDPGGHDGGRHNDGKDSILGVRGYWERWLVRALR
ncbi:hypothetical protein C7974DRAFT_441594 [Boeremia exigua]|uniref:uncharacterized protein n=1 Tax=Boeremia exigua TaxID=749465 RepID=UPI001E8E5302|nr:uncharacterized protein C7974DRAFT_441594 [Boeremia exigua]KAH6618984.1 hypothetical protein C7974DRAFT_441594 [Boeremia exigua]